MRSAAQLSTWVVLAVVLSFSTSTLGQSKVNVIGVSENSILNNAPAGFLALVFGPGGGNGGSWGGNGGGNGGGCGNEGWGGDGRDNRGWDGGNGRGGCASVPEGGTTLTYIALAGLCCLGAMVLRFRRQARSEAN
jgi:hypothetical protein